MCRCILLSAYVSVILNTSSKFFFHRDFRTAFLVFNNISNGDKLQCQRISDANNASNTFSSLFANVLGSDHAKHNTSISDNSLIISLLKLCSSLIQTELPRQLSVTFKKLFV